MDLKQNYFELFGLAEVFAVDKEALAARYRELQAETHPDRFASASGQEKRIAQQRASLVNDAFATLKSSQRRARYLLELRGVPVDERRQLPPAFLIEQMELREGLEGARGADDPMETVEEVLAEVRRALKGMDTELGEAFADGGVEALEHAAGITLKMQFFLKLEEDALKLEEEFY
ncbi:Fe-S protein assembly co-chaperone HscB [Endothiovibrio diazotrophicus]